MTVSAPARLVRNRSSGFCKSISGSARLRWRSHCYFSCTDSIFVMAGRSRLKDGVASARLCPAIHVFLAYFEARTWMPGTRPGMTSSR